MIGLSFKQSQRDHTLFIRHSEIGGVTMLLVYVDDIIVTCNDEERTTVFGYTLSQGVWD